MHILHSLIVRILNNFISDYLMYWVETIGVPLYYLKLIYLPKIEKDR